MEEKREPVKIHGIGLDENGRCVHYHKRCDVAALRCSECGKYYACFECHDALEDHPFRAAGPEVASPVLCGVCRRLLTRQEYAEGRCPGCGTAFNPRCSLHHDIYFRE